LWLGYSKVDTFIVGRLLGVDVLGLYSVDSQIAMAFSQFVSAAYYRVLFPLLSKSQDSPRFNEILLKSSVYLSVVTLPMMLGMAVVAPDIVLVFLGEKWQDVTQTLQVLSIVAAVLTLSGLLPQAMNAVGRADVSIWINLISLVTFGIGFYFGAQWQGINGILIVWLVLAPLRYIANVAISCSLLGIRVAEYTRKHAGSFVSTLTMLPLVMIVAEAVDAWPAAYRLFLLVIIGASAYAAFSFLFMRQSCMELLAMLKVPKRDAV
jgi:PST family polysaccharide transporter